MNRDFLFSPVGSFETKTSQLNKIYEEVCVVEPRFRSLHSLAPLRHNDRREETVVTTPSGRKKRSTIPLGVKKVALYLYELYLKEYSSASIKDIAETIQIDYLSPWLQ